MINKPPYKLSQRAKHDLIEIGKYIGHDSEYYACLWLERTYDVIELIATHPEIGRNRSNFTTQKRIKFYPHGNYFIIYRINKTVEILRIISSYRNIPKLLLAR